MDRDLICLIVCFIVGIFLFYLLKQSCGCQVVEGNSDKLHWPRTCKAIIDIIGCDGLSSYPTTNKYFINCNPYCDSNVAPACPPPPPFLLHHHLFQTVISTILSHNIWMEVVISEVNTVT